MTDNEIIAFAVIMVVAPWLSTRFRTAARNAFDSQTIGKDGRLTRIGTWFRVVLRMTGQIIAWKAALGLIVFMVYASVGDYQKMAAGKFVEVRRSCKAAVDLESQKAYQTATDLKDEIGIEVLIREEKVIPLERGTRVLVVES